MKETAIYVRQSADRADSVSLETQEALCRLDLPADAAVSVYRDQGYSGKNTERPALREMMQAVTENRISTVLVYKLDRISRNLADFTQLLRCFEAHGTAFRSHTEQFETASPMGRAMQSLLMVFAQLERETISGRVRDAAFSRAKMGLDTGGPPPAGFRKIAAELHGIHTQLLAPDSDASLIAAGFSAYPEADGSLAGICRLWNDAGFRTRHGNLWQPETLCRVLRNPVYVQANADVYAYLSAKGALLCTPEPLPEQHGIYLYADRRLNRSRFTDLHDVYAICAPHIGLIPPEIWLGCQQKLDASRRRRTLGKGLRTWLSGSIFCMYCGSAMTAVRGRNADYLICGGRKRGICKGAGAVWRIGDAEQLVGGLLADRMEQLRHAGGMLPRDAHTEALRRQLDALTLRRAELLRSLSDPAGGDVGLLQEAAAQLARQTDTIRTALALAEQPQPVLLPDWDACDAEMRKTAAQILLQCVLTEGETLHVFLR